MDAFCGGRKAGVLLSAFQYVVVHAFHAVVHILGNEGYLGMGVLKNGMSVYTGSIVFNRKQLRNELDRIYVDSLRFEKAKE